MPIYVYRCKQGHTHEKLQGFKAPNITLCPECKGRADRIMQPFGFALKGKGFHTTDYPKK